MQIPGREEARNTSSQVRYGARPCEAFRFIQASITSDRNDQKTQREKTTLMFGSLLSIKPGTDAPQTDTLVSDGFVDNKKHTVIIL